MAAAAGSPAPSRPRGAAKKPLGYDVYDSWRSIGGTQISRNGDWVVYELLAQDGDGELVARSLRNTTEHRTPRGRNPVITPDGKFVIFSIVPLKADMDKANKDKKERQEKPASGLGIMDLATGGLTAIDRIKSFKVPEDGGAFIAYLKEPPIPKPEDRQDEEKKLAEEKRPGRKEPGTDLVVRELAAGKETTIPEVSEYAWSKPGTWLAYAVSSKTPENDGAFVRRAADGETRGLLKGPGHYRGFAFDDGGTQLAFVSDRDSFKDAAPAFKLYHWANSGPSASELVPYPAGAMPRGWAISEHSALLFSSDGRRLFFGTAPAPRPDPEDAPEPLQVDIWHWKDPELQSMQKARADDERKRSFTAVIHLREKKLVQLGAPDLPDIRLSDDETIALGSTDIPYRQLISWDRRYSDYYLVNLSDGSRKKVLERSPHGPSLSPTGRHLLYFDEPDRQWHSYRITDGRRVNLTSKLGVRFEDEASDIPGQPAPYGIAGWTEGDQSVLIYDRYDIWAVRPDGSAARAVTAGWGRSAEVIFRYLRLDPEEKAIPAKSPLLLSAVDSRTKASGFYRVSSAGNGAPEKLIMMDKSLGGLQKAASSGTYIFTQQRFDEFPDLWASGFDFRSPRKLSDANPQQADFLWGKAELISYTNADGRSLQAVLVKPEDFDPGKKYPLIVYIYERLSDSLHSYSPPAPGTLINFSRYASNGYVLLRPDIVYDTGYPGQSCLKCVVPAVQRVLAEGYVDPRRVGIQGSSWGGYQVSYLVTRTDLFAAVEAGASVVDLVSAYGSIRLDSGISRAWQYEKSQGRIGGPPWVRSLQFIENSPIFWVEKVNTPYLTIHNDEDGAVLWFQGIEFFTALRRLGKEAYLFNYNGEKHGLRERANQKHWTVHMDEFFDHYLKGAPEPEWMTAGVPYLERGRRDIESLFKSKAKEELPAPNAAGRKEKPQ